MEVTSKSPWAKPPPPPSGPLVAPPPPPQHLMVRAVPRKFFGLFQVTPEVAVEKNSLRRLDIPRHRVQGRRQGAVTPCRRSGRPGPAGVGKGNSARLHPQIGGTAGGNGQHKQRVGGPHRDGPRRRVVELHK